MVLLSYDLPPWALLLSMAWDSQKPWLVKTSSLILNPNVSQLRPVPHGRQLPRTVGGDWPRGSQGYPTGGSSAPLWLMWPGSNPVPSSRGGRLELGLPPNAGPLPSAPASGRCQQGPVSKPQRAPLQPSRLPSEPLPPVLGNFLEGPLPTAAAGSGAASLPDSWRGPRGGAPLA